MSQETLGLPDSSSSVQICSGRALLLLLQVSTAVTAPWKLAESVGVFKSLNYSTKKGKIRGKVDMHPRSSLLKGSQENFLFWQIL